MRSASARADAASATGRRAGDHGNAELCGRLLGRDLVAHEPDVLGRGADEGEAVLFDHGGEIGVLREKADAGMDRVGAGDGGGREDGGDVEIALARRRRADADAFVGKPHMHRIGVGGRMHRDGADAHLAAGAVDAQRDLAAIGDEHLLEHLGARYSSTMSAWPILDRRAVGDQDLGDPAGARRVDLVHHLHRLDDQQRLAFAHVVAELDEGRAARLRREIGGADHRRLDRARRLGGLAGAGASAAAGSRAPAGRRRGRERRGCADRRRAYSISRQTGLVAAAPRASRTRSASTVRLPFAMKLKSPRQSRETPCSTSRAMASSART